MDNADIKPIIRYLVKKKMLTFEIMEDLVSTLGPNAPSRPTVKKWVRFFKKRKEIEEKNKKKADQSQAQFQKKIDKIFSMVLDDKRLQCREIAADMGMSEDNISDILENILQMKKYCSRWVPQYLSREQKLIRVRFAKKSLVHFENGSKDFMEKFITSDQTWIHFNVPLDEPEESDDSKQSSDVLPAAKMLLSVFWDAKGIILIDYHDQALTGEIYANSLNNLSKALKEKRPDLVNKKIILQQTNIELQNVPVAIAKLFELGFELFDHPPYSPDLSPSDYYLFPKLKANLNGLKLSSKEEVVTNVNEVLYKLHGVACNKAIDSLERRWKRCIEFRGEYIGAYLR
ncbi:unnamed protein product [Arctia plantaginis]|uniref:Transposase n=1 Tax=Arctia plantaginis TaxID=874455 RepID=A0A8S1ASV6_ARCPL|nr:unnamed protein product [Arctia plantaginis]